jgi:hypothetical protein
MNFKTEIKVEGEIVRGTIKNDEFHMVLLHPSSGSPQPPSPPSRPIKLTKNHLDLIINELESVKQKLR